MAVELKEGDRQTGSPNALWREMMISRFGSELYSPAVNTLFDQRAQAKKQRENKPITRLDIIHEMAAIRRSIISEQIEKVA